MSEYQRCPHDELPDLAVFVVVDVGSADTDRADLDKHFAAAWIGNSARFNPYVANAVEDCSWVFGQHA
jgi:hypothetical protein